MFINLIFFFVIFLDCLFYYLIICLLSYCEWIILRLCVVINDFIDRVVFLNVKKNFKNLFMFFYVCLN